MLPKPACMWTFSKGWGMEGVVAKWYAALTKKSLDDFKALARRIGEEIPPQCRVLEVAPGPGYFSIELAKSGGYQITGQDLCTALWLMQLLRKLT